MANTFGHRNCYYWYKSRPLVQYVRHYDWLWIKGLKFWKKWALNCAGQQVHEPSLGHSSNRQRTHIVSKLHAFLSSSRSIRVSLWHLHLSYSFRHFSIVTCELSCYRVHVLYSSFPYSVQHELSACLPI